MKTILRALALASICACTLRLSAQVGGGVFPPGNGGGNNATCLDATGSGTTYTCPMPTPAVSSLSGLLVAFVPQTTNSGSATLNVSGLGAKTLKQSDCATNLSASALTGGLMYLFAYNGTNFCQGSSSGGSGTASFVSQLGDFIATTTGSVQTLGAGCSTSTPCNIRVGNAILTVTSPITLTLVSGTTGDDIYWYATASGVFAGYNSANTYTCSGCTAAASTIAFPDPSIAGAVPLWHTTVTAGSPSTFTAINTSTMDKRAMLAGNAVSPGSGMVSANNPSTGVQTLSTDPTQVPRYFGGSGAPSINCMAARDFYTDSVAHNLYWCDATNTWAQANGGGGGLRTINGLSVGGFNNVASGLYPAWVLQNNAAGLSATLVATVGASITFANTGTPTISKSFWLPDDFSSALKLTLFLDDSQVAGGHVQFDYGLVCWVSGSAATNTMANTASTGSVAFTGSGNTQQTAALVIPTSGCSAGSQAIIQIARNNTVGSNMAAPVSLVDVKATYISAY